MTGNLAYRRRARKSKFKEWQKKSLKRACCNCGKPRSQYVAVWSSGVSLTKCTFCYNKMIKRRGNGADIGYRF